MNIEVVFKSGRLHSDADGLSRNPVDCPEPTEEIPTLTILANSEIKIGEEQENSRWWGPVIRKLRSGEGCTSRRRIARKLKFKDGILFRRVIWNGQEYFRLFVPENLTKDVLLDCHDDLTAGLWALPAPSIKSRSVFSGQS